MPLDEGSRSEQTTYAPSDAYRSAIHRPIPDDEPVIMAILSCRRVPSWGDAMVREVVESSNVENKNQIDEKSIRSKKRCTNHQIERFKKTSCSSRQNARSCVFIHSWLSPQDRTSRGNGRAF